MRLNDRPPLIEQPLDAAVATADQAVSSDPEKAAAEAQPHAWLGRAGPLVLARFGSAVLTTSIPLVLARLMRLDDYGTYKQIFLVAGTATAVLGLGMPQSLFFFLPRAKFGRPYVVQALAYLAVAGAAGAALIFAAVPSLARLFSNPGLIEHAGPMCLYVALFLAACPLEAMLTSQGKTGLAASIYVSSDALRAATMTLPILLGFGLSGTLWALCGLMAARTIAAWATAWRSTEGPFWSSSLVRRQLAYALPFGAAMALSIPQQFLHQYVVGSRVTPALFALYAAGCFQLPLVDLFYAPTSEVLMVRIGELERHGRLGEAAAAFREASARLAFLFLPAVAVLVVIAPEFIEAVFGQRFVAAAPLFRVSSLAILFASFPMDGVLRARGETRYIFLIYLAKLVVTVPLVFGLVSRLGLLGGVTAWLLAEFFGKVLLAWRLPRALGLRSGREAISRLVPWRSLGQAGTAALLAATALVGLRAFAPHLWQGLPHTLFWRVLPVLALGTAFGGLYAGALYLLGARPTELVSAFRRPRAVPGG